MVNCNNINCYSLINEEDIFLLENMKTHINFSAGEMIFKQGGLNSHIFLIFEGYVKLQLELTKTKKLNIYVAQKGDFLALSGLFNNEKYNYSAIAITEVTLCMVDKNAVHEIFSRNHQFLLFIAKRATEIENRLVDVLNSISQKQMRGKLASALLYLLNKDNFVENISESLTRQDVADFAGITVENTVSLLKEFDSGKIIELKGKSIIIRNENKMKEIAIKG